MKKYKSSLTLVALGVLAGSMGIATEAHAGTSVSGFGGTDPANAPTGGGGLSTSASDLQSVSNSDNNGSVESVNSGSNINSFSGRSINVQNNSAYDSQYVAIDGIRYASPSLTVEGGYNGSRYNNGFRNGNEQGNDFYVRAAVNIPLGGRKLPKRIAKARAQQALELHCLRAFQSGFILESCKDAGIQLADHYRPKSQPVVHQAPPVYQQPTQVHQQAPTSQPIQVKPQQAPVKAFY